jgi:hypothetical protein
METLNPKGSTTEVTEEHRGKPKRGSSLFLCDLGG